MIEVHDSAAEAGRAVAAEIAALARSGAVLGLATGASPLPVYAELVRLHRERNASFRRCTLFHLDEYWPLRRDHPQSFRSFLRRHLLDHLDVPAQSSHCPDGETPAEKLAEHCAGYEALIRAAGGIDLQLLGIGRNGHIGFNEPGSARDSRTRLIELETATRADAAADFGDLQQVPRHAITMGIASILEARRIVLLAFGARKAAILRRALEGPLTADVPASFLREHPDVRVVLDREAAAGLGGRSAQAAGWP